VSGSDLERVYAVPRDALFAGVTPWRGVELEGLEAVLERAGSLGDYVPRPAAEIDRSLKQIIPYLLLRDGDLVFLMKRTKAGGDARLHDLYTIGVGGHLNPGDAGVLGGLAREWREEIEADFMPEFEFVGLLKDDTVEVGVHHLGVVYLAEAAGRAVKVRETDKLSGSFEKIEVLRAVYDRMETWSQLAFEAIVGSDLLRRPSFRAMRRGNSE
jgi:predicted NUDIX family phosphoesterase